METRKLQPLTPEEAQIIIHKGTERPFTGEYYQLKAQGTYLCRQCLTPLFHATQKFDSGCGWPSFDDDLPGEVLRIPDADGRRTEIVCRTCHGHLGHVFVGEQFTDKNTRHCVNSLSLRFVPEVIPPRYQRALLAMGCFWNSSFFWQNTPGVVATLVGYTGGHIPFPTYIQLANNQSEHAEVVQIDFVPEQISYAQILQRFFMHHNFNDASRQMEQKGKHRSAIFYYTDAQRLIAEQTAQQLKTKGLSVLTQIAPVTAFYPAEERHQNYYTRQGKTPPMPPYTPIFT